jgi:hypothetical protein
MASFACVAISRVLVLIRRLESMLMADFAPSLVVEAQSQN